MFTLAMPQSLPRVDRNVSIEYRLLVKIEDESPCDTSLQEQTAQRSAALPGRAHGAKESSPHDQIRVRIVHNDRAIVTTQFQKAAAQSARHHLAHVSPHTC